MSGLGGLFDSGEPGRESPQTQPPTVPAKPEFEVKQAKPTSPFIRWCRRLWWLIAFPILVVAASLTAVRWFQPGEPIAVRWLSFTPYAVPAYLALILLCLWRGAFRRLRWWWLTLVFVLLAPLGLHVWWLAPQALGPNPSPDDSATALVVLTLNAHGKADAAAIVRAVADHDLDVIVMQEVTPELATRLADSGLDSLMPYEVGESAEGSAGTMVWSRFPMSSPVVIGTTFVSLRTTVSTTAGPVELVATHPYPPVEVSLWRSDHRALLAASRGADVIAGDLNLTPDHRPYQTLQRAGWRSVAERVNAGWVPTWPANGEVKLLGLVGIGPLIQIDHVMISEEWAALRHRRIAISGTDHLGVIATIAAK